MIYPRIVEKTLDHLLNKPEILILYGPRRVGKTTLIKKLFERFRKSNPSAFYSLDDPSSNSLFKDFSGKRLAKIFSEIGFKKDFQNYLFLDEIQSFINIDLLLKLIYDNFPKIKVIATSSSSLLLINSLTESLAGRKYFIEILPLTLSEYERLEIGNYFSFSDLLTKKEELKIDLDNMAVFGSYPEILNLDTNQDKIAKLRDILDSSLYKDIFVQENIKAPKSLISLVQLLSYQIGNLINLNELSNKLGISRNTVNEYISILEKFFIVFRLSPFERNLRSEITSKQKIYFWDLGVRNAVINNFSPFSVRDDKGSVFENIIVAGILRRNIYEGKPFQPFFWRTYEGFEIDLVLKEVESNNILGFQISLSTKIRFSRAFNKYNPKTKIAVSYLNGYKFIL